MVSNFHKRQINKIAATLNPPRQPKRWTSKPDALTQAVQNATEPAFEIKNFVPVTPQSSLTTNDGWEYQENGYSYSSRPR